MSDVPEADAIEQSEPVVPDVDDETTDLPAEAPEADALEQHTPAAPAVKSRPPRVRDDVPEADALEQAEAVEDPDDERG